MPERRISAFACALGSKVYLIGGKGPGCTVTSTTFCYDVETDAWSTLAAMPEAKKHHSICAFEGLIYVLGGESNVGESASVHCFDPGANSWSTMSSLSTPRSAGASFVLNGSIHVAGGRGRDERRRTVSVELGRSGRYESVEDIVERPCDARRDESL